MPPLAAAIAHEPPSISKAWAAFLAHIPTILLIWVATIVLSVIGVVASLALTAQGVGLSGSGAGGDAASGLAALLGNLVQLPFTILSNLVGVLFTVPAAIGFVLCILPGVPVTLVMPVYVNTVFLTDGPILDAFSSSFQAVYGSAKGRTFAGIELIAWLLLVVVVSIFTCFLGSLVAVPVATFYIQNAAYHQGVLS